MKTPQPFDWFGPKACKSLYDQLGAVGPEDARLEVYRNDKGAMMLQVRRVDHDGGAAKDSDDPTLPPINDSFICPPIC